MIKKESYSKYRRAFGMTFQEIKAMPRVKFAEKFGEKFKFMTNSKFLKAIEQVARAFEHGQDVLSEYK